MVSLRPLWWTMQLDDGMNIIQEGMHVVVCLEELARSTNERCKYPFSQQVHISVEDKI